MGRIREVSVCWAATIPVRRTRYGSAAWASSHPSAPGFVRDLTAQVGDDVQPTAPLVVVVHDVPGRPPRARLDQHRVASPEVGIPPAVGLQVRGRELPDLPRVVDPVLEPPGLLVAADVEEVLD